MSKNPKASKNKAKDVEKPGPDSAKEALWAQYGKLQANRESHQGAIMAIENQMRKVYAQIMKE